MAREVNLKTKEFQSEQKGEIIVDPRLFGVEIEAVSMKSNAVSILAQQISTSFGFHHDGSISGDGVEIVTPIMSGGLGEKAIYDLTARMLELGFDTNNSCGLHVHLDANNLLSNDYVVVEKLDYTYSTFLHTCFQPKLFDLLRSFGMSLEDILNISGKSSNVKMRFTPPTTGDITKLPAKKIIFKKGEESTAIYFYQINNYHFLAKKAQAFEVFAKGELSTNTEVLPKNVVALSVEHNNEKVKAILYAYTALSDVFLSMLPEDRRTNGLYSSTGRDYCQKLIDRISPFDIEKCRTTADVETLWLKTKNKNEIAYKKRDKYDESRYYGVNFHSLFAKYGTIEIRWHEGTLNPKKILYWVATHQHILRLLEENKVTIDMMRPVLNLLGVPSKVEYFFKIFKFPYILEKYLRHRIEFFTNNQN